MQSTAFAFIAVSVVAVTPVYAQVAHQHRHPRGAKIIMNGTLVDPVCAFARQLADSAQAHCSRQHAGAPLAPALLADGELYLLAFDNADRASTSQALVGQQVKVDGTVYPAGNAYLIVVDSLRRANP